MTEHLPHLRVVAAVFRRRPAGSAVDEVLACRRAPETSQAGAWEFPGGKIEAGESPEAALAREIREELDVTVRVGACIDRSATPVGERVIDLACYEITGYDRLPASSTDHDALRWVLMTELDRLAWAAPDLPAVARLSQGAGSGTR